ncbi:hypothetical protein KO317_01070 [Candidatus Micrarchaeota archaeon]|nr:hypothetical protein [Candidatus Micrarchaeota archaeon]
MNRKVILELPNQQKIIPNAVIGELRIRVRKVSPNKKLFEALTVLEENNLPLPRFDLLDKLIVNEDGSRNDKVCNALQSEYGISDLWTGPIFAHEKPNTKIESIIYREYPNGAKRRIITLEDIRGEANLIQAYPKDKLLIPGKHFTYKMKNGVLEFEFDQQDLIAHELPVEDGKYPDGYWPTNKLTGLPDPNGKGPQRKAYFWNYDSAISAVFRWLGDNYDGVSLYSYYSPRGVLEIAQDA